MFCIHCGTNLPEEAAFCSSCGRATSTPPESATTSSTPPAVATPVEGVAGDEPAADERSFGEYLRENWPPLALVGAVIVIVLVVLGSNLVGFVSDGPNKDECVDRVVARVEAEYLAAEEGTTYYAFREVLDAYQRNLNLGADYAAEAAARAAEPYCGRGGALRTD